MKFLTIKISMFFMQFCSFGFKSLNLSYILFNFFNRTKNSTLAINNVKKCS